MPMIIFAVASSGWQSDASSIKDVTPAPAILCKFTTMLITSKLQEENAKV